MVWKVRNMNKRILYLFILPLVLIFCAKGYPDTCYWENLGIFRFFNPGEDLEKALSSLSSREKICGIHDPELCPYIEEAGDQYLNMALFSQAERAYRRSLFIKYRAEDQDGMRNTSYRLVNLYLERGDYDHGLTLMEEILNEQRKKFGVQNTEVALAECQLAVLLRLRGQYRDSMKLYEHALPILEAAGHEELHFHLSNFGFLFYHQARYEEARGLFQKALSLLEEPGRNDFTTDYRFLGYRGYIAHCMAAEGNYSEAEELFMDSLRIAEDLYGKGMFYEKFWHWDLAHFYRNWGRTWEAEYHYRYAADIFIIGVNPELDTLLREIASFYSDQGRFIEAEAILRKCLEAHEVVYGKDHPGRSRVLKDLGVLFREWARIENRADLFQKAESYLNQALSIHAGYYSPCHSFRSETLHDMAVLYHYLGWFEEAEALYKSALDIRERSSGICCSRVGLILRDLARLYMDTGRMGEAKELQARAEKIPLIDPYFE